MGSTETKVCARCGRRFSWRPKWKRNWEQMRYCSATCRTRRLRKVDRTLEREMLQLLKRRSPKTVCPSEVARAVDADRWRALMEPSRQAARRLVAKGQAEILQGGARVDPSHAKGPIRVRLVG